jgi:hypothetical protein
MSITFIAQADASVANEKAADDASAVRYRGESELGHKYYGFSLVHTLRITAKRLLITHGSPDKADIGDADD